jgi:hypothetical protein
MLVSTMNHQEITKEILKEQEIFNYSTTILRLTSEYYDERKKKKVKKDDEYPRYYDIKTKAKNKWSILLSKDRSLSHYNSPLDFDIRFFTYYYSDKGIRVFESLPEEIIVHNQHFFSRYRERMNLNILNIIDVVKLYHQKNPDPRYNLMAEQDGRSKFVAIVDDGFAMGEYIVEDNWYINKTFLAKSAPNSKMSSTERSVIAALIDFMSKLDKTKEKEHYDDLKKLLMSLAPQGYEGLFKEMDGMPGE